MLIKNIIEELPKNSDTNRVWMRRNHHSIGKIIIHHSAGWCYSTPFDTANYHITKHGWPGVAYHYEIPYVTENIIHQMNYLNRWCYHTGAGFNADGIGILVRGGFHSKWSADQKWTLPHPAEHQIKTLEWLLYYLRTEFLLNRNEVFGHFQAGKRACPGDFLERWILEYRAGSDAKIN